MACAPASEPGLDCAVRRRRETDDLNVVHDAVTELVPLPSQGEALAWLWESGRVTGRETDDEGRTRS